MRKLVFVFDLFNRQRSKVKRLLPKVARTHELNCVEYHLTCSIVFGIFLSCFTIFSKLIFWAKSLLGLLFWYQCFHLARRGQMVSGRWRRRYEAVINSTPFLDSFYSPDTIPLYDPPPTGDGHIYVQFTVTSTNGLVKHVLVSSLSNRRPETHWKAFWWWSHITPGWWWWWPEFLPQPELHPGSRVFRALRYMWDT